MGRRDAERAEPNIDEAAVEVGSPKTRAVGVPAVAHATQMAVQQMGPRRAAETHQRLVAGEEVGHGRSLERDHALGKRRARRTMRIMRGSAPGSTPPGRQRSRKGRNRALTAD